MHDNVRKMTKKTQECHKPINMSKSAEESRVKLNLDKSKLRIKIQ